MKQTSVRKNFILNVIYQIFVIITPLITTPYVSRVLGSGGIGECAYYAAYASYFTLFSLLGIPSYGRRSIAQVSDDRRKRSQRFHELYSLQLISSTIVVVVYCLCVHYIWSDNKFAWIYAGNVIACCFDISWLYFGMERFSVTVTRSIIIKLLSICGIFIFVKTSNDGIVYAILSVVGVMVSNFILFPILPRVIDVKFGISKEAKTHLISVLVLLIPSLATEIYKVMDKTMLGLMTNMSEVGMYESSEKVIRLPLAFVSALGAVMIPRISHLVSKKDEETSSKYFTKSIIIVTFLSSSMCFGIVGIADLFVPVFYGVGFEKCISLLTILMPSCIFLAFANVVRTQHLLPHEMDKQLSMSLIIGSVTNLVLNYLLIPISASIGAAIATLITEFIVCFFQCYFARKAIYIKKHLLVAFPFCVSGVVMCVVLRMIHVTIVNTLITIVLKIIIGICLYFALLLSVSKAINNTDINETLNEVGYSLKRIVKKYD